MAELIFRDPRDYLKFEHELRRARRPAYSMRAFARDLDVSPSSLNDFLKGRVGMSVDRIERFATVLQWTEKRKEHFRDLITAKYEKDVGARQSAQTRIRSRIKDGSFGVTLDAFKAISDWYHFVILELCECRDQMTAASITRELKLPAVTISKAVKRLIDLGMLAETGTGLKPVDSTSHFGDEAPSGALVSFHCQMLELAQKALLEKPMAERSSQSVVFSVNKDDVMKMNLELKKAVMDIANRYAQTKKRDRIQAVTLQSFGLWTDSSESEAK